MKNIVIVFGLCSLLFASCNKDDVMSVDHDTRVPIVYSNATFDFNFDEDIVYGQGFMHETLNSQNKVVMPLKLDIYTPVNESVNRPLFVFIHGGGFKSGSKQQNAIKSIADFYVRRGWVFISIDYRIVVESQTVPVTYSVGTVPNEWASVTSTLLNNGNPISEENRASTNQMYPAVRDAKAALRWIIANKGNYNINADYITVGGASAGANISKTIAVSELSDFTNEISTETDSTLSTTNLGQEYEIKTIVDFWGGLGTSDLFEMTYGRNLFDSNDPVLYKAHGNEDNTVPFQSALDLQGIYNSIGVTMKLDELTGEGHSAFNATINGKRLEELAFEFIVEQQNLTVE